MAATIVKADERVWQPWAMVTDGHELYEVSGVKTVGGFPTPTRWLEVENCRTGEFQQFSANVVRQHLTLVRKAPDACPDYPAER